jgi:hypothetical protein
MSTRYSLRGIGVFASRRAAERVLPGLQNGGLSMSQVSVIAKDANEVKTATADVPSKQLTDKTFVYERVQTSSATGGVVGGITGLLVGLGTLVIPGLGPVMLAGTAATAITPTHTDSTIATAKGGLLGKLIGLGIPEDHAQIYNDYITRGEYLLIVDGTAEEVNKAELILKARGVHEWATYPFPSYY